MSAILHEIGAEAVEHLALFRNTDAVPDAPQTWDEVFALTEDE